jgi:hypothetical protein
MTTLPQRNARKLVWRNLDPEYTLESQSGQALMKTYTEVSQPSDNASSGTDMVVTAHHDVQEHPIGPLRGPMGCVRRDQAVSWERCEESRG